MKSGDKVHHVKYGEGMVVQYYTTKPAGAEVIFNRGRYWFDPEHFGEIPVVAVASYGDETIGVRPRGYWEITAKRIAAFKWAAEWLDYAQTRLGLGERSHMIVFREMLDESKP
jgi:hypothetical protein